jgi:hypothetical protein
LRGRGGSELAALAGHDAGAEITLIDDRLRPLPEHAALQSSNGRFAAIGLGDETPAQAVLENVGAWGKPPFPVHGRVVRQGDGALWLAWTRRARGGWTWLDEVEQPLAEDRETYEVGLGPVASPFARWTVAAPNLVLDAQTMSRIEVDHPGEPLWVRQIGSFATSDPLMLTTLATS